MSQWTLTHAKPVQLAFSVRLVIKQCLISMINVERENRYLVESKFSSQVQIKKLNEEKFRFETQFNESQALINHSHDAQVTESHELKAKLEENDASTCQKPRTDIEIERKKETT